MLMIDRITCRQLRPHPNVVTLLGVCLKDPNICIVTEYVDGGSLDKLIYNFKQELDLRSIVKIAKDAASGMVHLHSENIIHADLAARNLLVNRNKQHLQRVLEFYSLSFSDFKSWK